MNHHIRKYLSIFRRNIILLILIVGLIIASSVTKGRTSVTLSIITGAVMICAGISFVVWIIKTPSKKNKDEAL